MLDVLAQNAVLTLFLVVAAGSLVGLIPFGPIRFGPAGALFVGLLLGAFDERLGRDLGLVRTIGLWRLTRRWARSRSTPTHGAVAAGLSGVVIDDEPHASEHAIETQLPFLIRILGSAVPVLPVVVGDTATAGRRHAAVHPARRTRHGRRRLHRPEPLPGPSDGARTRHATAAAVLARDGDALHPADACGFHPPARAPAPRRGPRPRSSSCSGWPRRRTPGVIPGASSDTEPSCSMRELANPLRVPELAHGVSSAVTGRGLVLNIRPPRTGRRRILPCTGC